jgi:hypothetical protein
MQAQQEAISALRCIMVTLSDADKGSIQDKRNVRSAAGALAAAVPSLREALQAARYHRICHVRDAAGLALTELIALVPEPSKQAAAPPTLQMPRGRQARRAASGQKGPWLHQRRHEASNGPHPGKQPSHDVLDSSEHPIASLQHKPHSSGCDAF